MAMASCVPVVMVPCAARSMAPRFVEALAQSIARSDAGNAGQISESLRAMMWPYTIHLQPAQRELFEATVLTLLREMPPGTIGPGTITQACRTAQRQVLKGEVQRKGARF
jgi:hypothetical protein